MAAELKSFLGIDKDKGYPTQELALVILGFLKLLGKPNEQDKDFYIGQLTLDATAQRISHRDAVTDETALELLKHLR